MFSGKVTDFIAFAEIIKDPTLIDRACVQEIADAVKDGLGEFSFEDGNPFLENGAYRNKVIARVTNAQDPAEEARKLTDMFIANADLEHNESNGSYVTTLNDAVAGITNAKTPEEKTSAIKMFARQYGSIVNSVFTAMESTENVIGELRLKEEVGQIQPKSFASALMGILMDNFDALSGTFADSRLKLMLDVKTISMKELGLGILSGEDATVAAIKKDARDMPGDSGILLQDRRGLMANRMFSTDRMRMKRNLPDGLP